MGRVLERQQSLLKCKRNKQSSVNHFLEIIIDLVHCDCRVALLLACMMAGGGVAVDWAPHLRWRTRDYGSAWATAEMEWSYHRKEWNVECFEQ